MKVIALMMGVLYCPLLGGKNHADLDSASLASANHSEGIGDLFLNDCSSMGGPFTCTP